MELDNAVIDSEDNEAKAGIAEWVKVNDWGSVPQVGVVVKVAN